MNGGSSSCNCKLGHDPAGTLTHRSSPSPAPVVAERLWVVWLILTVLAGLALLVFVTQPRNRSELPLVLLFGLVAPTLLLWRTERLAALGIDQAGAFQQFLRTVLFIPLVFVTNGLLWILDETKRLSDVAFFTIEELVHTSTWILVPLVLYRLGSWRWPQHNRPTLSAFALGAHIALLICLIRVVSDPEVGKLAEVPASHAVVALPLIVSFAFAEEVVFRVMLLSYLAVWLRSPLAALAVSSAFFGFFHVPFDVVSDWPEYVLDNTTAGPLYRAALGAFFGALWMRTRSLLLIGSAHSLFNLVPLLLDHFDEWS